MLLTIYHGNEEWVLKGIAVDLQKALKEFGVDAYRWGSFTERNPIGAKGYHFFVQQGQLLEYTKKNGTKHLKRTICLFTHIDTMNFNKNLLNSCRKIIFNSTVQLRMAVANGLDQGKCVVLPHGVDPKMHRILGSEELKCLVGKMPDKWILEKNAVGFCGRYWEKYTYVRRKNYGMVLNIARRCLLSGQRVIFLGKDWIKLWHKRDVQERNEAMGLTQNILSERLRIVETEYKNYPLFYNLMKVFVSCSVHEGGPLPLLESMCCGVYPIASATGFADDVITCRGDGAVIRKIDCEDQFMKEINKAAAGEVDRERVRSSAEKHSFERLAEYVLSCNDSDMIK